MSEDQGLTYLINLSIGSYAGAVVVAADQAGIFPLLVSHPEGLTTEEVVTKLGLNARVAEVVLPALYHLRILEEGKGGRYRAGELATRHLDPAAPAYGGACLALLQGGAWSRMGQLGRYLTGEETVENAVYVPDSDFLRTFMAGWNPFGVATATAFTHQVDLSDCLRIMDVGAGSGAWIIAALSAAPQATAVAVDLPYMPEVIPGYVAEAGLSGRVEYVKADLFTDELPRGFDTVFVNELFHSWDIEHRAIGLEKVYVSLDPGGTLYIVEHMIDPEGPQGQTIAAVAGLQLRVQTGQGRSYTTVDYEQGLREAGFTDVRAIPFGGQPGATHIVSGRKP